MKPFNSLPKPSRLVMALAPACCALALAACGERRTDTSTSQVAAQVGQGEVSIHQVNLVLQRQPDLRPEQVESASRTALERLVQLELAVQKANEAKIDRDPQVVQALDFARREVLARAYIDRLAETAGKPSAQDIDRFYDERPALFKTRRIYSVQEIGIVASTDRLSALQTRLTAARTVPAMLAELNAGGLNYTLASATKPAEDWALPVLDKLASMSEGQVEFLPQPPGLRVLVLTGSTPAPRKLEEARQPIEQFLLNERKQQKVDAELKAMRGTTPVKYLGKFAQAAPGAAAAGTAAGPASAPPVATGNGKAELEAEARNKGIQGLR
ncbi:EpsD family peptidyl-prolyl cis-trans isomerase [Methylibium petroleiphilum]|uniref:EpsD family peptidyl-prolyl cis-trans isomerase n=1 Tax=Methylibium petroleiphilum TaxID=105560 RepID=UPI001AC9603D|nr:EpsD family peptidyl-prolyl cis-trans isomerase [Methylibium petroleiphilum]MBN9204118.1 EpsD family peptidyl-prolyl cis-trans isomerase [Methylibium petroleiphilum]